MLEGARRLAGQAPQQRSLLIGQFQQPGPGEQSEGRLQHRNQQQSQHQQDAQQQRLGRQFIEIRIGGPPDPPARERLQLEHQPLAEQCSDRQHHRQLKQLAAAALPPSDQCSGSGDDHCHQQASVPETVHRFRPEQRRDRHPHQAASRAQPLGDHQGRRHQHRQRADRALEPELGALHQQQQGQRQQGMAHFKSGPFAAHHQQHHGAGGQRLEEMAEPDRRLRFPPDLAEVVENVVGLRTDRLPLAGDQISRPHLDGGNSLFGELRFDQLLAEVGIRAQIAAALERAGEQLGGERPCRRLFGHEITHLQPHRFPELPLGETAHQPLAEHAVSRSAQGVIPGETLVFAAFLQPALFVRVEIDRSDPRR